MRLLFALCLLLVGTSVARADVNLQPNVLTDAALIALIFCQVASYGLRRLSAAGGFLHTAAGAYVLSIASLVTTSVAGSVQAHGLDRHSIIFGLFASLGSFLATSNPSTPIGQLAPLARRLPVAAIIFLAMTPAFASLSACNTVAGKAAIAEGKACESGLKQTAESQGISAVTTALADPIAWEADLLSLGATYTVEQLTCLVRMAVAAAKTLLHPATDGGIPLASFRASYPPNIVVANGEAWIAKHGAK